MKIQSLGAITGDGACITCSGSTNATPIVLTVNTQHGLVPGDRIAVSGVTGNTGANGIWTISAVADTTVTLAGSVGNGSHGGTVRVGVVMDKTPFIEGGTGVLAFGDRGTASTAVVATLTLESYANYTDFAAGDNETGGATVPVANILWTATAGNTTTPCSSAKAATATVPLHPVTVRFSRIMRAVVSSHTSGTVNPVLMA